MPPSDHSGGDEMRNDFTVPLEDENCVTKAIEIFGGRVCVCLNRERMCAVFQLNVIGSHRITP